MKWVYGGDLACLVGTESLSKHGRLIVKSQTVNHFVAWVILLTLETQISYMCSKCIFIGHEGEKALHKSDPQTWLMSISRLVKSESDLAITFANINTS